MAAITNGLTKRTSSSGEQASIAAGFVVVSSGFEQTLYILSAAYGFGSPTVHRMGSVDVWAASSLDGTGPIYAVDAYSRRDSTFPILTAETPKRDAIDGMAESIACVLKEVEAHSGPNGLPYSGSPTPSG
jgi:hypothetical protein